MRRDRRRISARSPIGTLALACALLAGIIPVRDAMAQGDRSPREILDRREQGEAIQADGFRAMASGDYERAAAHFREHAELEPGNFAPRYNLACALSMLGRTDEALRSLEEAIERGFLDLGYIRRDRSLGAVRSTDRFAEIERSWEKILDAAGEALLERARKTYGPRYEYRTDPDLRIHLASAFHPLANDAAMEEMRTITQWAMREVFADLRDAPREEFAWALVVLPSQRDFNRWAVARYGPQAVGGAFHRIGGAYVHDERTLVSMDLGSTFRHEFFHVLHWRSNVRAGHVHPVWIQEGLCSLVEDVEFEAGGLRPTPSWRTNMLKRRASSVRLPGIADFVSMSRGAFTGDSPLANYAQARAIFLHLADRGKLGAFYGALVEGFDQDPTGLRAIEQAMGMEADAIDRDFLQWLRALPDVPEVTPEGRMLGLRASIGAEVSPGTGEGPVIARLVSREARASGLRMRDVLVAINGRPVRDMNDFARVMGDVFPGQRIGITVRRGNALLDLDATTVAR